MARPRLRRRLKSLTRLSPQYKWHRPPYLTFHASVNPVRRGLDGFTSAWLQSLCQNFVKLDRNEMPGCGEIR